jgi:hypothetical protein
MPNIPYNCPENFLIIMFCEDEVLHDAAKRSLCLTNAIFIEHTCAPKN